MRSILDGSSFGMRDHFVASSDKLPSAELLSYREIPARGSRFFRPLEVHGQIAVKAHLVLASAVVVGFTLIGSLKPDLGPKLRDAVGP